LKNSRQLGDRTYKVHLADPPVRGERFHRLQTIRGCASGALKIADHRAR
jgi:hypothetical protein